MKKTIHSINRHKYFSTHIIKYAMPLLLLAFRSFILLILYCTLPIHLNAQNNLPETTGDKYYDKIFAIEQEYYKRSIFDSALLYSFTAGRYAEKIKDKKLIAASLFHTGKCYTSLTKYDSAWHYLNKALAAALDIKDNRLLIQCYNSFAVLYNFQSDNATSIGYLLKSIDIIEKNPGERLQSFLPLIYSNIGYILDADKQYEKSIGYHRKAYESRKYASDTAQLVMIYQNFFVAHLNKGDILLSKKYLDAAFLLNKHFPLSLRQVYISNNYGIYYEALKDSSNALVHYLSTYHLCDSIKNDYFKTTVAISISKLYFGKGNLTEAGKYAKEAAKIAAYLKNYTDAAAGFGILKDIEKKKGRFIEAFQYLDSFNIFSDSLNAQETRKNILMIETKFQTGQKEKEIVQLKVINTEKELAVIKRSRFLLIGGISASFMLITLGLLYRNSRHKQALAVKEQILQQEQIKFLERQQQVISLQSMVNGQEAERTRIAKDLHDGLGGLFSTVKMYFSTLQHEQHVLQNNSLFTKSYELIDTAAEEVRRIAHNMMPEVLMKLGLIHALQDMCSNVSAGKLIHVKLLSYGMDKRMNISTEIMLYRIIQELLNNIIKHAQASEAIIQFNRDTERLTVTVEDNGRGFNLQEAAEKKHAGLDTIKSRVTYLNGNISIDSQQEIGTTVMMEFLVNEEG